MNNGWEIKQFGDVLEIRNGRNQREVQREDGQFPIYGSGGNVMGYANQYLCDAGTTIIGRKGSINNPIYIDTPFWNVDTAFGLSAKSNLDSRFLYYFCISYDFSRHNQGTTIPSLVKTDLLKIPMPLPPIDEQKRIVAILDEAFEAIDKAKQNAEKNLQNARELFESYLQNIFIHRGKDWVEKTLESFCEQVFAGGDVPKDRLSPERTAKFSVPIYSNGEKYDGLYGYTDVARVTKPSITVSARGTLGFTAIRTEPFLPVVRLIVLVPDQKQITLSFLYYAVVGMDFGNTGTSIPQLTVPNFKESKLYVPSLSEQEAIVEKLDALATETQRLESIYQQKQGALATLVKSLLHQAFVGEL